LQILPGEVSCSARAARREADAADDEARCKNQAIESKVPVANFRRSQRYPFRLDILLKGTYRNTPTTTEDVSFHGIFIRSDEERAPNQLLKFIVVDPRNGEHVELLGIVARCVARAEAATNRPPGVGVSLFGNDRGTEARWVAIMRQIKVWVELGHRSPPPLRPDALPIGGEGQSTLVGVPRPAAPNPTPLPSAVARPTPAGDTALPPVRVAPSTTGVHAPIVPPPPTGAAPLGPRDATPPPLPHGIDATKRAHERRPAKFNVTLRPDGIAALQQFEIKDISEGGTFVLTPTLIPLGSRVNLRLVHPQSGETFQIAGLVARAVDSLEESEKGIGIKFDVDTLDRRAWTEFVGRLAPVRRELPPDVPPPPVPGVRVLRTPTAPPVPTVDPPILLGTDEAPVRDPSLTEPVVGDPGLPPVILDGRERPVPVLLGPGLHPPHKP
jgi:Tfp pilus assembly protein PilZ